MQPLRWLKWGLAATGLIVGMVALLFQLRPSTAQWPHFPVASAPADASLSVSWLGTSTLLISDGKTHLLTDGYFSRVSKTALLGKLSPNPTRINNALTLAQIKTLEAVLVVHSHFDHVLDAPWVALKTNADLVGSESTVNVGRGAGMPEEKLIVATAGEPIHYGKFEVVFLHSAHVPQSPAIDALTGMGETIDTPLTPPAPAQAWKEGGSYALLFKHPQGDILVQGSAGFVEGQLDGYHADIAFVSSVGLSRQPRGYTDDYVRNTIAATGARVVVPIHWDDFFTPLEPGATKPLPRLMEDLNGSFAQLDAAAKKYGATMYRLEPTQTLHFSHTTLANLMPSDSTQATQALQPQAAPSVTPAAD